MKSALSGRLLTLYAILFIVMTYGPVLLIPLFSFSDGIYVAFPIEAYTTKWYEALWNDKTLGKALWTSTKVAVIACSTATVVALMAAMALTRYKLRFGRAIHGMTLAPMIIPSLILGISILALLRLVLDIDLSIWTIVMGHILVCLPYSFLVLIARFEGFDKSLTEASADLGENGWMTFWRVTFPIALPGIVSSWLTGFTTSFDEFVIASFLSQSEQTLPIFIWSQLRFPQKLPVTLALGASMFMISILLILISEWVRRRGTPATQKTSA